MVWQKLGRSEVTNFQTLVGFCVLLRVDQNVVRLDIPVCDAEFVHMGNPLEELIHQLLYEIDALGVAGAILEGVPRFLVPPRKRSWHEVRNQV